MALLHRWMASLVPLLLLASLTASVHALAQDSAPPSWEQIDALVKEQKLEAAAQGAEARLAAARAKGDEDEWTRALVRTVQLRTALHEYETSVRFLREQPWPKGAVARTLLRLFYAQSLVTYTRESSYEVRQRERVESAGPVDLKAWTYEQLIAEAHRAFAEVWKEREQLSGVPVNALSGYLAANTYPAGIRSTLRDAVSYLWVGLLVDSASWRPEQQELHQLDLGVLLSGTAPVELSDPSVHPLMKVAAILGDLEAWHRVAGRREAELEARLERYQRLHGAFSEEEEQARIRQHLAAHLERFRDVAWWAMGQGLLAELERKAGYRLRAREVAKACAAAYPNSLGGQRCASLVSGLEAPWFSVQSMHTDGLRRRSIQVTHRNVPALHFRAYACDAEELVTQSPFISMEPPAELLTRLLKQGQPVASWREALPATTDLQDHRSFITPPLTESGLYFIAVSAREDFAEQGNKVDGLLLTVTPYVALARGGGGGIEVRVVDGTTGQPSRGRQVRLFLQDYDKGRIQVHNARTDSQGEVVFKPRRGELGRSFVVVVGQGREALVLHEALTFWGNGDPPLVSQALIFTDRSIYRPLQKILWKVVAFEGGGERARYKTQVNTQVKVSLHDENGQVVEQRQVRTNAFGSASGEFTIPAGRGLGSWSIATEPRGKASVRVEEYKRPTFEVTLKDPEAPLRLNRPAVFRGEARYYFGLPVASGSVRWRVFREPVMPGWSQSEDGWPQDAEATRRVVAAGSAALKEDGSFQLSFTPQEDERAAKRRDITWRYRVEADATDEGGETRSASRAFRLGFAAVEARVALDRGFVRQGAPAEARLIRSSLEGCPSRARDAGSSWRCGSPHSRCCPRMSPCCLTSTSPGRRVARSASPRWETRCVPGGARSTLPSGACAPGRTAHRGPRAWWSMMPRGWPG